MDPSSLKLIVISEYISFRLPPRSSMSWGCSHAHLGSGSCLAFWVPESGFPVTSFVTVFLTLFTRRLTWALTVFPKKMQNARRNRIDLFILCDLIYYQI